MNADRLLKHYEKIEEAPEAIARLRQFVLDLAVRGKLLQQDSNDEPASALLKQIAVEKLRRVKAGEIKKPREPEAVASISVPFDIPDSWKWIRLNDVGAVVGGGTPSASNSANFAKPGKGIPWLTPADLGGHADLFVSRGARDLSEQGLNTSSAILMPAGAVLFTSRAPIGYVAIAANPIATNQGFKSIVPYITECSRYIAVAMRAFAPEIDAKAPATTFKEVSGKIVAAVPFPLPPLAEQHRIAAKVDELMELCDQLKAARAMREVARDRLSAASLARLGAPDPDPETSSADARFALDALPALTSRPDQIKFLRRAILNLSARGKLVPQDPNDGSVDDLLLTFAHRRSELIKKGMLKRAVDACHIDSETPLAKIPNSWRWVPLGKLLSFGPQNGLSPRTVDSMEAPRAITLTATTSGFFVESQYKHVDANVSEDSEYWLRDGDLLFQRGNTRDYVGIAAVYTNAQHKLLYPDLIMKVRLFDELCLNYVHRAMISPEARRYFSTNAIGAQATMPKINQQILISAPVPLPPVGEQERIVAKVDELMALCDRLERSLNASDDSRRRLLVTLLKESLETQAPLREVECDAQ